MWGFGNGECRACWKLCCSEILCVCLLLLTTSYLSDLVCRVCGCLFQEHLFFEVYKRSQTRHVLILENVLERAVNLVANECC